MDDDVKALLEEAERYRIFTEDKLRMTCSDHETEDLERNYWSDYTSAHSAKWEQLKLMFLIPQAHFADNVDLIHLAGMRVYTQVAAIMAENSTDYKLTEAVNKWTETVERVRSSGIMHEVTPIQRRLLEQYFFVLFPDREKDA